METKKTDTIDNILIGFAIALVIFMMVLSGYAFGQRSICKEIHKLEYENPPTCITEP
jgi:hypothetical protein